MDFIREVIGGGLGFIAIIAMFYFGYKFYRSRKKKDKEGSKQYILPLVISFFFLAIAGAILPEQEETKRNETTSNISSKPKEEKIEKPKQEKIVAVSKKKIDFSKDPERMFKSVAEEAVGRQYKNNPKVEEVLYSDVDEVPHVLLKLRGIPAEHVLLQESIDILKLLRDEGYKGHTAFFWLTPAIDKYNNEIEIKGLNFTVKSEDLEKINFKGFIPEYLKNIVKGDGYSVHPTVTPAKY